jgi:hypothetical protein
MSAQATSTDPGSKSASEIEREVEQSRADIEHTLDAIQDRLSPGQMLDKAMGVFRGGSGDFARNLGDSIAANPVPLALIGLGVAWMMYSSQRPARPTYRAETGYWDEDLDEIEDYYAGFAEEEESFAGYPGDEGAYVGPETETGEGFGEHLKGAGRTAKGKVGALGERARHAGERVRHASDRARHAAERARRAGEQARERFGRAGEQARERFGRARAGMAESAHEAGAQLRQHGYRATRGMRRTLDEQPLVLGAIGLAIGAALGAALPPTETEDELMGEARDKALREATRAGREQAGKVREAAGAVAAAAREEAGRQGLTPKSSGEAGEATSGQQFAGNAGATGQSTPPGTAGAAPFPTDPETGVDRS